METNREIRQRLEFYKIILLVANWVVAGIIVIMGLRLFDYSQAIGTGFITIIGAIVGGVLGHFLIHVALSIPFILLNNGDTLEAIKKSVGGNSGGNTSGTSSGTRSFVRDKRQKKCTRCKKEIDEDYTACPHCGNDTFD